jgi:hypothetical protein
MEVNGRKKEIDLKEAKEIIDDNEIIQRVVRTYEKVFVLEEGEED